MTPLHRPCPSHSRRSQDEFEDCSSVNEVRIIDGNRRILHFNVGRARVVEDIVAYVAGARGLVAFTVSSGELGRTVKLAHRSSKSKARRLRDCVYITSRVLSAADQGSWSIQFALNDGWYSLRDDMYINNGTGSNYICAQKVLAYGKGKK
jgi:hypothetical protein